MFYTVMIGSFFAGAYLATVVTMVVLGAVNFWAVAFPLFIVASTWVWFMKRMNKIFTFAVDKQD